MAKVKDKLQYVFIHPSWRGAWCWDQVLSVMRAWGREAYAPDGPGHGSRLHEIERVSLADYPRGLLRVYQAAKSQPGCARRQ
jgi:hypothetical protein